MFERKNGTKFVTAFRNCLSMKQKRLHTRFITSALALLLLLAATAGKSLTFHVNTTSKEVIEQLSKEKKANDERPVVQEMSLDAVVAPAITFDFAQTFYFLPPVFGLELPFVSTVLKRFDIFYYFFSFFQNVFGHFIAINAP
ncbi:MAG: hypothetical protein R2822_02885 [Spirosomataceae bacterium]